MQQNIEQALHNQKFHDCIDSHMPDEFFDWKIVALFYISIHCLKALASIKGLDIGDNHRDIHNSVDPNRKSSSVMPLTYSAWKEYHQLFLYSQSARYDGITDMTTWQLLKRQDYKYAKNNLKNLKKYFKDQGLEIPFPDEE